MAKKGKKKSAKPATEKEPTPSIPREPAGVRSASDTEDQEFFEFCLDLFRHERAESHRLYSKLPLGVSANVIVGGAIAFITDNAYVDHVFARPDAFFYYFFALLGASSLIVSTFFLARSLIPREYDLTSPPAWWCEWRKVEESRLREDEPDATDEQVHQRMRVYTRGAILQQLSEVTGTNREINKRRARYFVYACWFTVGAVVPVILQWVFGTILWLQFR